MGEKIKSYLDSHGIKQTFLAEQTGINYSRLTDILTRARRIEVTEYYRICKVLNVPLDYFFEE